MLVCKTKYYVNFGWVGSLIFPEDVVYHISNCVMTNCRCKAIEKINTVKPLKSEIPAIPKTFLRNLAA